MALLLTGLEKGYSRSHFASKKSTKTVFLLDKTAFPLDELGMS